MLDKGKSDVFLPVIGTELTEEQRDYVLKRLRKLKHHPEIDHLVKQFIKKVQYNELNESDLKMLNKLLELRLQIRFLD
ncbi:MAG: hypothetical protein FH760_02925 [Geosporobacter ferrireducens]|nr:hypothetical protein [Geosporobacter ferrireducens]